MANNIVQLTDDTNNNIFPIAGGMASDSITTAMLQDGAVTTAKLASGAVTAPKLADRAVNRMVFTDGNLAPSEDTPEAWSALFNSTIGFYVTYYNTLNIFANQPSQWGFLETFITNNNVYQRWVDHRAGPLMYRAGNNSGWSPSSGEFKQIFDTVHNNITMQTTDPGEGATLEAGHFIAVYS